jgi:hypothetical protein
MLVKLTPEVIIISSSSHISGIDHLLLQQLQFDDEPAGDSGRSHLSDRQLFHLLIQTGVNFINILRDSILYESALRSFSLITVRLYIVSAKEYLQKSAC